METTVNSKKSQNESFSRKEVSFCEEASILFYAVEGTVDSLNDNERQYVKNDNFPLSSETLNRLKNSNIMGSDSKYTSEQCLNNLPEAVVVLEKLSEDLFHRYAHFSNDMHCCIMPTTENTNKSSSLKSGSFNLENFTEPAINEISPVLKRNKYPLQNSKSSLDNFINENCENEKSCSTVHAYSKNIAKKVPKLSGLNNTKRKTSKVSKKNEKHSVSTDHSPDSIQQPLLQNSVRLSSPLKSLNAYTSECVNKINFAKKDNIKFIDSVASVNIMDQSNCKISFDKYPCVHLERLNLGPHLESILNTYNNCLQNKQDNKNALKRPMDLDLEVGNIINNLAGLSVSQEGVHDNESVNDIFFKTVDSSLSIIDEEENSDLSVSENIYPEKSKKSLSDNLPKIPSNVDDFLSESSSSDEAFQENDVSCENSSLYKNIQNRFPFVVLERLNLPLIDTDGINCYTDSARTDIDEDDLHLKIKDVCSISRKKFNKTQNHRKIISKNITKKIQKNVKNSSNLYHTDQFKDREINITISTANNVYPFNNFESSLENLSTPSNSSISEYDSLMSLSKQKLMNAHLFHDFTDSSLNDSVSKNISLPTVSKKIMNDHSYHKSLTIETKANSSHIKSCKNKKKNSIRSNVLSSLMKTNAGLPATKNAHSKPHNCKGNSLVDFIKNNKTLTTKTKANSSHIKSCKHKKKNSIKENSLHCNPKYSSTPKKPLNSQTLFKVSNKILKGNNSSKSMQLSSLIKKKKKKSSKKKQLKIYKMMIKYLKLQIKSKKQKKKSSKKKNLQKKSENSVLSNSKRDSDSNDSVTVIFDSTGQTDINSFEKGKTSTQCEAVSLSETVSLGESSIVKKKEKRKKHKTNVDKYRLGFLSNKQSLRFYNKFLASERLLLSKCKKNEKKEFKRLFNKLKTVGFMKYK